jgi:hypothetical protein
MGKKVEISDYDFISRHLQTLNERSGQQLNHTDFIQMMIDFIFSHPEDSTGMRLKWLEYTERCFPTKKIIFLFPAHHCRQAERRDGNDDQIYQQRQSIAQDE